MSGVGMSGGGMSGGGGSWGGPGGGGTGGGGTGGGRIVEVLGGSNGIEMRREEVRALAQEFSLAADTMRDWSLDTAKVAFDGDLLESSVLSPVTFALAETEVRRATAGPVGLLVASLEWEADALVIRSVVTAFEACDVLIASTMEGLDHKAGVLVGAAVRSTLVVNAPAVLTVAVAAYVAYRLTPESTKEAAAAEVQDRLEHHPELLEHMFNSGGGLVDGFWLGPLGGSRLLGRSTTESAARDLARLFGPDGTPVVRRHGRTGDIDPATRSPARVDPVAPRGVADLLRNLGQVAALSVGARSAHNGTISVQTLDSGSGRRHVVYLPGTDDLGTLPGGQDHDVRDTATNLRALGGAETTYARGVLEAMGRAGIQPGEPVLLVGHSQGGIVASTLAANPGGYAITNVVTAGSPIGAHPAPGVPTLSLENTADLIPLVDGETNDESGAHVTVRFTEARGNFGDNHGYDAYLVGAKNTDATEDGSVRDAIRRLHGFTDDTTSTRVQVWQVSRG